MNVLCLSSSDKLPFVSSDSYSKLVLRAINLEDTKMLQRLINDSQRVSGVKARNSPVLLSRFSSFSPTVTDRTCIPAEPDALGREVRERVAAMHRKTQRRVSQAPPRPAPTERRQQDEAARRPHAEHHITDGDRNVSTIFCRIHYPVCFYWSLLFHVGTTLRRLAFLTFAS